MTATQLFEWFLWGAFANDLTGASDEFVLHDFLIQLMGNTLHLTFEGAGSAPDDSAKALAEKYVRGIFRPLFQEPNEMPVDIGGDRHFGVGIGSRCRFGCTPSCKPVRDAAR